MSDMTERQVVVVTTEAMPWTVNAARVAQRKLF